MPCSLAIRRGLRRAELPADAREREGRTSKKGEGEGGHREEGRPVYPRERTEGWRWGVGRERERDKKRLGDLCTLYEGCGMGRYMYRGHAHANGRKEDKGRGGNGEEETE